VGWDYTVTCRGGWNGVTVLTHTQLGLTVTHYRVCSTCLNMTKLVLPKEELQSNEHI
jgi:hypothetical protein